MDLESFIRAPRRWQWGGMPVAVNGIHMPGEDCTTFVGSWVQEVSGFDPAADLRGTYSTAEEAAAVIAREGGIEAIGDVRLGRLGWYRVDTPADGDIGIVAAVSGVDLTCKEIPAIRFGPLWALMGPRGAMVKKLDWSGVSWRAP